MLNWILAEFFFAFKFQGWCFHHFNEKVKACPTLCDPTGCSLPGSSTHGIFQARVLECGAIAFFNTLMRICRILVAQSQGCVYMFILITKDFPILQISWLFLLHFFFRRSSWDYLLSKIWSSFYVIYFFSPVIFFLFYSLLIVFC